MHLHVKIMKNNMNVMLLLDVHGQIMEYVVNSLNVQIIL